MIVRNKKHVYEATKLLDSRHLWSFCFISTMQQLKEYCGLMHGYWYMVVLLNVVIPFIIAEEADVLH